MNTESKIDEKAEPKTEHDFVDEIVRLYEGEEGMLIPMLQDIQAEYGYLPADYLRALSRALKVPLARIYGVATFYASFRLSPKGQHDVTLCMGTVCYLKGSARISEVIRAEYGVEPGGTTSDRLFTLNLVNCVGACALAPVMIVDGKYHDAVTPESALKILRKLSPEEGEGGKPSEEAKARGEATGGPTEEGMKARGAEPATAHGKREEQNGTVETSKPAGRAAADKTPVEAERAVPAPGSPSTEAVRRAGAEKRGAPAAKAAANKTAKKSSTKKQPGKASAAPVGKAVKTESKKTGKKAPSRRASKAAPEKKTGRK